MRSNPFQPLANRDNLPEKIYTDFSEHDGDFIVEYGTVQRIKQLGKNDTDFILIDDVVETNRIPRTEYINSFRSDVGILNIIEKVRLSGDITLLNQSGRVGYGASGEKDSLGRDLEPIVDVTEYQVDPVDGIEKIKAAHGIIDTMDPELVDGKSLESLAKMSDDELNAYLAQKKQEIIAAREKAAEKGE